MHFVSSFFDWVLAELCPGSEVKWAIYSKKTGASCHIWGNADKPVASQFCEEQVKDSSPSHETSEVYTYSFL